MAKKMGTAKMPPKGMPPKDMPPKGMHPMPGGMMMSDAEMKGMTGKAPAKKGAKKGKR